MQCPRCGIALTPGKLDGFPVQACSKCKGRWLSEEELPELEETVEPDPNWREGTIEWYETESKLQCPVCGEEMESFNYRDDGIMLDTCKEKHGYWLDAGESDEVRDAMKKRVQELRRAQKEEIQWGAFIYKLGNPSWVNRLDRFLFGESKE